MNARTLTFVSAGFLACAAAVGCEDAGSGTASVEAAANEGAAATAPRDLESELLRRVNDYRVARGLNALIDSSALRDVARAYSVTMRSNGHFDHQSPEGLALGDRLNAAGVPWTVAGENLAKDISGAEAVLSAWLNSPDHRANLDSEEWTHAGAGWVPPGHPGEAPHVTLVFVRP